MTTYGLVNGLYTAGSYDLNTTILRNEWGFTGVVNEEAHQIGRELADRLLEGKYSYVLTTIS